MEDNDAINIVIINPCKETCRCRSIIFLHPCPQLLPGAGRERGLSWGWVVCLIVNTNPRYTQHVQITGDPASAFVNQGSSCLKNQSEVQPGIRRDGHILFEVEMYLQKGCIMVSGVGSS